LPEIDIPSYYQENKIRVEKIVLLSPECAIIAETPWLGVDKNEIEQLQAKECNLKNIFKPTRKKVFALRVYHMIRIKACNKCEN